MAALSQCISDMINCADLLINNSGKYYDSDSIAGIIRWIARGRTERASEDIGYIEQAAGKCIETIDKHKKLK